MASPTLDYARTSVSVRGMPVSATVWSSGLVGASVAIVILLAPQSEWPLVAVLAMVPVPAAVLAAGALVRRTRWRLLITLASLSLCGQSAVLTAVATVVAIIDRPKGEGALVLASACLFSNAVSLPLGIAAAVFATFRRSWYEPAHPAWHRRWLRAAPKILVIWLLLMWLLAAFIS